MVLNVDDDGAHTDHQSRHMSHRRLLLGGDRGTVYKTKLNSVALVRERTIPTERPPPVGEVSTNFCG
jgi:hypothetical protein